ncbi:Mu transposase domain-containing protein [Erysipelothrix larvae]|uniref:Mu transposase domain-containing protein n=1 Tax=Erysipelothrix larvae TaxID=1514105 RepID=UPI003AB04EED
MEQAKVQSNSHIAFRKHYYSVLHAYIGQLVKLRITKETIQVYSDLLLLCEHKLKHDQDSMRYSTFPDHMPPIVMPTMSGIKPDIRIGRNKKDRIHSRLYNVSFPEARSNKNNIKRSIHYSS